MILFLLLLSNSYPAMPYRPIIVYGLVTRYGPQSNCPAQVVSIKIFTETFATF